MKKSQSRNREQNRKQKQVRARLRTEDMRLAHDALDLPGKLPPLPGPLPDDGDPEAGRFRPQNRIASGGLSLRDLLRSRPLRIHLRLLEQGETVDVRMGVRPRSVKMREALQELADLVKHVFNVNRAAFNSEEWAGLLHGRNTTPAQRLVLLSRLAIPADTRLAGARVPFTPHDRSLKRFHSKFATLPDGTPFSLRWLLRDQRGKRGTPAPGFLALPDPLLLLAVRRALALEAAEKKARSDYAIGPLLRRCLEEMGISLTTAPSEEEVRTLRERRAWKKLDLFPKAARRQQAYAAEPSFASSSGVP